ncbi:hypothetical protein [Streptomyces sp. NPDC047981]|uniref:hypothetical protein n=1 Tax=Streptomyces sp. NPDC047981 TaxID=3154610 RepID=UPI00341BCC20
MNDVTHVLTVLNDSAEARAWGLAVLLLVGAAAAGAFRLGTRLRCPRGRTDAVGEPRQGDTTTI